MRTDDLNFHLPPELIAQTPADDRAHARLLHYRRSDRSIAHRTFGELPALLGRDDLLVFNDARVIPARFTLVKSTGGHVEGLFIEEISLGKWHVLLKNVGRSTGVLRFLDMPDVEVRLIERGEEGRHVIEISSDAPAMEILHRVGRMPLPPYIKRSRDHDDRDDLDRQRYQTVFAREENSIAAPTAGLHFTPPILDELDRAGVARTSVTLEVGLGTFKPISAERIEDHPMHVERYRISRETAITLNAAKGKRQMIAVGTTSARVLESQPEQFEEKSGETRLLISPGYKWKHVGSMITNFHLPRSTLIALVASFVGLDEQRRIYQTAIGERYRFFSYGDAMFIE